MPRTPPDVVFDGIIAEAFVEKERNRNHVREKEGCDVDGHDGVEGRGAADVDEGDEQRNCRAD